MAEEMLLEMQVTKDHETAEHDLEGAPSCKDDEETTNETVIQVVRASRDGGQELPMDLPLTAAGENTSSRGYAQKYRPQWEQEPMFADWLMPVPGDPYSAACRSCQTTLCAHRKLLVLHCTSQKHVQRLGAAVDAHYTPERRISRSRGRPRVIRAARAPPPYSSPAADPPPPPIPLLADSLEAESCLDDIAFSDPSRLTYSPALTGVRRVGFVGASCQAQLVARGMLHRGLVSPDQVFVSAADELDLDVWRGWGCQVSGDPSYDQVFSQCDLVFLAIRPDQLDPVIDSLSSQAVFSDGEGSDSVDGSAAMGQCVVSLVTGVSREQVSELLTRRLSVLRRVGLPHVPCHVVRCVFSAAVMVGDGCCLFSCRVQTPSAWLLVLHALFSALGVCQQVEDESLLDALAGLCDSGTAFALTFIEALAAGAVNGGVSWPMARALAVQTTLGAARLLVETGRTPAEMREEISVPGGATMSGQMALEQHGLRHSVMMAVDAATRSSRHLAGSSNTSLHSANSSEQR